MSSQTMLKTLRDLLPPYPPSQYTIKRDFIKPYDCSKLGLKTLQDFLLHFLPDDTINFLKNL